VESRSTEPGRWSEFCRWIRSLEAQGPRGFSPRRGNPWGRAVASRTASWHLLPTHGKEEGVRFSPCREPTRPRSYLGPRCGPGQVQLPRVQGKDSRRVWERSHCLRNDEPESSGESHGERSPMSHSSRLMEGCTRGRPCRRPKDHTSADEAGYTCDPGRPTSMRVEWRPRRINP